ncbi:unnamed protein product, partial [marine sediment metagenome]
RVPDEYIAIAAVCPIGRQAYDCTEAAFKFPIAAVRKSWFGDII